MRLSTFLAATLGLCATLPADSGGTAVVPYGAGQGGTGGITPRAWVRGNPYLGSATFQLAVDRGLGGALAVLLLSTRSARIPFGTGEFLLDPTAPLFGVWGVALLSGAPGMPGTGAGQAAVPIPPDPLLEGATLFAQWLVIDAGGAGGIALSDGVQVTLRRGALVLGVGNQLLTYGTPPGPAQQQSFSSSAFDVQFNRAGTLAFVVGGGNGGNTVTILDATQLPMTVVGGYVPAELPNCLAVHPSQARAYVPLASRTAPGIDVVDTVRGSPTFGQRVGGVTGLQNASGIIDMEGASISADGRVLVVAVLGLIGTRSLVVVDVDPASATRDTFLRQLPVNNPGGFITDVDVSADGLLGFTCHASLFGGSDVAMIDLATGLTVTSTAHAGRFSTDIDLDPRGRFLVIANPNSSDIAVVDLEPGPGFFQVRALPAGNAFFSVALGPDGSQVFGVGQNGGFTGYDVATGATVWSVTSASGEGIAVR